MTEKVKLCQVSEKPLTLKMKTSDASWPLVIWWLTPGMVGLILNPSSRSYRKMLTPTGQAARFAPFFISGCRVAYKLQLAHD